jgi:hypothetical protein
MCVHPTLAYLVMDSLLAQTQNSEITKRKRTKFVIVGAYDFSKPKGRAAFNGSPP